MNELGTHELITYLFRGPRIGLTNHPPQNSPSSKVALTVQATIAKGTYPELQVREKDGGSYLRYTSSLYLSSNQDHHSQPFLTFSVVAQNVVLWQFSLRLYSTHQRRRCPFRRSISRAHQSLSRFLRPCVRHWARCQRQSQDHQSHRECPNHHEDATYLCQFRHHPL